MKKLFTLTLLLSLFLSLEAKEVATQQPIFNITDTQGKHYTMTGTDNGLIVQGMEDKIIFLEFFGHRCPPCLATIPHLVKLQKKYKEKLAIIAVEVQGYNNAQLQKFVQKKGMNYIVVADENSANLVNYISQRAQWKGSIPFMLALDTKGAVQFIQVGMIPEASLEELVHQLSVKK